MAPRPLTRDESDILRALIAQGTTTDAVTASDRERWARAVPDTRAGAPCGCGTCPSVELTDADGATPESGTRVVLEASAPDGCLLLFIDDDRLSYLEYAPLAEAVLPGFPRVEAIRFD